jgi:hypothetical protein
VSKLKVTLDQIVRRMVDSITDEANHCDPVVSLKGLKNVNDLDDLFNDRSGQIRCEKFCDVAWEYSLQFGSLESRGFEDAQQRAISAALKLLAKEVT